MSVIEPRGRTSAHCGPVLRHTPCIGYRCASDGAGCTGRVGWRRSTASLSRRACTGRTAADSVAVTEPTPLDAQADTDTALHFLAARAMQSRPLSVDTRVLVVEPCLARPQQPPATRRRTIASAPGLTVASHGAQPPGRRHATRCDNRPSACCTGRPHPRPHPHDTARIASAIAYQSAFEIGC